MSIAESSIADIPEREWRQWRWVAVHEAAHAVVATETDDVPSLINIFKNESGIIEGRCHRGPTASDQERLLSDGVGYSDFCGRIRDIVAIAPVDPPESLCAQLSIYLAGFAFALPADRALAFQSSSLDFDQANALAQALTSPKISAMQLLNDAIRQAAEICDRHRGAILALGDRLVVRRRMDGDNIRAALAECGCPTSRRVCDPDDPWEWPSSFAAKRLHLYAQQPNVSAP